MVSTKKVGPIVSRRDIARRMGHRFNAAAESMGKDGIQGSYSGTDIRAVLSLPILGDISSIIAGDNKPVIKEFAELQTISISSTRSISPVRALGKSSPLAYTRGARTIAGSMVFATFNLDVFNDVYKTDRLAESPLVTSITSLADQLPPFDVVITASNELGAAAVQVIRGITLSHYGTTYSIDDIFTESSFTYVATDASPLLESATSGLGASGGAGWPTIASFITKALGRPYGTDGDSRDTPAGFKIDQRNLERFHQQNSEFAKNFGLVPAKVDNSTLLWQKNEYLRYR